ncbi:MAG TPA: cysteine hydrolase, partial [Dokdonella sp.]
MRSALLIIDVISTFDFPGGGALLRHTRAIAPTIERLKARARAARCPIVYCNDHFGEWRADLHML